LEEGILVPNTDRVVEYRQVITKAVVGKGRKFSQVTHSIETPDHVHNVLGAWVINHQFESAKVGEAIEVQGSYDVNIWYSTKGNTKTDVMKETVNYVEQVPLSYFDPHTRELSVSVSAAATQSPNCVEASISSNHDAVVVRVEKEFVVELVGETKVTVACYPAEYAEVDDKDYVFQSQNGEEGFEELDPDLIIDDLED
jgi:spore coat protein E